MKSGDRINFKRLCGTLVLEILPKNYLICRQEGISAWNKNCKSFDPVFDLNKEFKIMPGQEAE